MMTYGHVGHHDECCAKGLGLSLSLLFMLKEISGSGEKDIVIICKSICFQILSTCTNQPESKKYALTKEISMVF